MEESATPEKLRPRDRAALASFGAAAIAVTIWTIAYVTGTIDSITLPWDSLIYGAVAATLAVAGVLGAVATLTSSAGRWRFLTLVPLGVVSFLWWILLFYGQTSTDGSQDRDVISEFASRPSYVPIMTLLTVVIGLPPVVSWIRRRGGEGNA